MTVWSTGPCPTGQHSVEIVRSASSAAGKNVTLDAVDIWGTIRLPHPLRADRHPHRQGRVVDQLLQERGLRRKLRTLAHESPAAASATIYFTGTRLDWIAMKGTTAGVADVYLDGTLVATIVLHKTSGAAYEVMVWSTGTLLEGNHTVRIVRNSDSGTDRYLTLDAVEIGGPSRPRRRSVRGGAPSHR